MQRAIDHGDVFLGDYEGWYDVKEEAFVTEKDAELLNYKDSAGQVFAHVCCREAYARSQT